MCVLIIVYNCRAQQHKAQSSFANFPSYPPDNHRSSDDVYWKGGTHDSSEHMTKAGPTRCKSSNLSCLRHCLGMRCGLSIRVSLRTCSLRHVTTFVLQNTTSSCNKNILNHQNIFHTTCTFCDIQHTTKHH